ncbi:hypothetical protein YC2023_010846 [Brassica napus]
MRRNEKEKEKIFLMNVNLFKELRIIRLGRNYNKQSGNTLVFVDKEGTRIHASVGEHLIKNFEDDLTEGDALVVQVFKVYDSIGDCRTTTHSYKIGFFQSTIVAKPNDFASEVSEKYFENAF